MSGKRIGKRMLEDLELIEKQGPQPAVWWTGTDLRRLQDYGLVSVEPSTIHGQEVVLTEKGRQELARRRKP